MGYDEVRAEIDKKYGQNRDFLEDAKAHIQEKLAENKIDFILEGRVKSVYSLYKKMYGLNKAFDEIYDFYAVRIIVHSELECYTALGLVHEMFIQGLYFHAKAKSLPIIAYIGYWQKRNPI